MPPAKTIRPRRPGIRLAGLAGLLALTGCRSPGPARPPDPPPAVQDVLSGELLRVNTRDRYVVLRCTVLPSAGKEVTVFRRDQPVGKVRITDPRSAPFATADIVEGSPRRGDRIRE